MTDTATTSVPKCSDCSLEAAYDYCRKDGKWAFGCTAHWMQHRKEKKLGAETAQHIVKGKPLPTRPEGAVAYVPETPAKAPKPANGTPSGDAPAGASAPKTKAPRAPKPPRVWADMEPGKEQQAPRDGSVLAISLALMASTEGGATMEELQKALDSAKGEGKHDVLTLLTWANKERGHGFRMDPTTKRIVALIPAPKAEKPKKTKPSPAPATEPARASTEPAAATDATVEASA